MATPRLKKEQLTKAERFAPWAFSLVLYLAVAICVIVQLNIGFRWWLTIVGFVILFIANSAMFGFIMRENYEDGVKEGWIDPNEKIDKKDKWVTGFAKKMLLYIALMIGLGVIAAKWLI